MNGVFTSCELVENMDMCRALNVRYRIPENNTQCTQMREVMLSDLRRNVKIECDTTRAKLIRFGPFVLICFPPPSRCRSSTELRRTCSRMLPGMLGHTVSAPHPQPLLTTHTRAQWLRRSGAQVRKLLRHRQPLHTRRWPLPGENRCAVESEIGRCRGRQGGVGSTAADRRYQVTVDGAARCGETRRDAARCGEMREGEARCRTRRDMVDHVEPPSQAAAPGAQRWSIDEREFYDLFLARYLPCYSCRQV